MRGIKKPKGFGRMGGVSARLIKPTKVKAIPVPRGGGAGRLGGLGGVPSLTGAAGGGRGRRKKPGIL